jgi:DNA repair protein RadC
MNVKAQSNQELLARLIGKRAAYRLRGAYLSTLFHGHSGLAPLHVARELVLRSLHEDLQAGNIFSDPSRVREYLQVHFKAYEREVFVVMYIDTQHRLIETVEMFRGSLNSTEVHPREIVKEGLRRNAAAVIVAHNHPSGCAEPSQADRILTGRIAEALQLVQMRLLDHFVVGGPTIVSLAERGWL